MAKIVVKGKEMKPKGKKYGWLAASILFLILYILNHSPIFAILAFLMLIFFTASGSASNISRSQRNIENAGIKGENALRRMLCELPDSYCGFQNATVTYDGKTSELDIILIGPTGIFVIENKNQNGTITGNIGDQQWTQQKVGRRGGEYFKSFYNPVKQVGTHVYRLANRLRSGGHNVYIHAAVFFSNSAASVHVQGDQSKIPVFSCSDHGESQLFDYIVNRERVLSSDAVNRIYAFLDNEHP